jgi:hypothetical protein
VRRAAAILVTLAAAGCGSDGEQAPRAQPVGEANQGSVVQVADCRDWRKGSLAEKRATVVALRGQLTPQSSETAESPLPDERALEILDNSCRPAYASSLRLYKLYVRAQAFARLG